MLRFPHARPWSLAVAIAACAGAVASDARAEPHFVDLEGIANRSAIDDGVAGNQAGGWSDEGPNDMFMYPPLDTGVTRRNGHELRLIDPAANDGNNVVMLRGEQMPDLPAAVKADVPAVRGKYVYFAQNAIRIPESVVAEDPVARYTIHYQDGTSASIALHYQQELRHWYTGSWWDNSGRASWPVYMGTNAVSGRWRQHIGAWAMQWDNPEPEKPIVAITLASEGNVVPAIFAVTITDEDYHTGEHIKEHFERPPGPPSGYFDGPLAAERAKAYEAMVEQGLAEGVRGVEVIRPNLIAVTVDAAASGGPGRGEERAAALQDSERFTIRPADEQDATALHPDRVGRLSYEYWNGPIEPFSQQMVYWHTYYLELPQALEPGKPYAVDVAGLDEGMRSDATIRFDPAETVVRPIKVNQVGYSAQATQRYAYLGWWAADLGAVDYEDFDTFVVYDRATGGAALRGDLALRRAEDALSGEQVHEMDISALDAGEYYLVVEGLGRSSDFNVGGEAVRELYYHTNRAYYHQRAGVALEEPYTTFTTPAHHYRVYEGGHLEGASNYKPEPGEEVRAFTGGYHDAADFDVFTYHLRATAQTLAAFEMTPDAFGDGDLDIPESGNGLPDLLDDADWALQTYMELQQDDGAVPLGRGNDQDYIRDYENRHGHRPAFGIFPPTTLSTLEYAAVAAFYARVVEPYDGARSRAYAASARRALKWAIDNPAEGDNVERANRLFLLWAAAEVYSATGDRATHRVFQQAVEDGGLDSYHWSYANWVPMCIWAYATSERQDVNSEIQKRLRARVLRDADYRVQRSPEPAYRVGSGERDKGFGWGTMNGGGHQADVLVRAHRLTGDQKYLDAASLNADFQLGCNPLSKTFITSMGARPPRHPQISAYLYTGPNKTGQTVSGITVYGLADRQPDWYPEETPAWRRWRDLGNGGAEISSEFTITETIGASSLLYSRLWAIEQADGK